MQCNVTNCMIIWDTIHRCRQRPNEE
ncbi:leader peptide [Atlantic salmon swim bladder sarcoma virus]|nr:leader peptide [Atlantic salmon swim bladder sarcoma virus]ABA54981.1 leader peptide [Atlantic salmon swim bladder sarcoma virus]